MPRDRTAPLAKQHRWEAIARDAAGGLSPGQLARKYEYTPGGMYSLLRNREMQERIEVYKSHYLAAITGAQVQAALALPELIAAELAIALPEGEAGEKLRWTDTSQKARQFMIRQVWPSTTRVEQSVTAELAGPAAEVATQIRDVLVALNNSNAERRRLSIIDSPHVREGASALPQSLPVAQLPATTTPTND